MMIIAIDIGNTNVAVYGMKKENVNFTVAFSFKVPTDATFSVEEYRNRIEAGICEFAKEIGDAKNESVVYEAVLVASVVPAVTGLVESACEGVFATPVYVLKNADNRLLQLKVDEPDKVGFDRIADATGAVALLANQNTLLRPVMTVDFGTATTMNVIDENRCFLGGMIAPGMKTGLDAIVSRGAQLPPIPLASPQQLIGRNTTECLQSGIVYSAACMVDGAIAQLEGEFGRDFDLVITGGGAGFVDPIIRHKHYYEPDLLIRGMIEIWEKMLDSSTSTNYNV